MLIDLRVRGLGVIEDLTLTLGPGMTALTGETGAGKTLVVEALSLVLGGRASAGLVRAGAEEALIEARFAPSPADAGDDPAGGDEVILARSVSSGGRSRGWIDGRMVPLGALAETGAALVDIHGQHEHQSLVTPAAQRHALDAFGGLDPAPAADARRQLGELDRRLAALGGDESARARAADVLRHQVREIEAALIADPDEEVGLLAAETRLSEAGELRRAAAEALSVVDPSAEFAGRGEDVDARTQLGRAITALSGRPALAELERHLRQVAAEAEEVAHELRVVVETWEDDPGELARVQERRRVLAELRRKYGPQLTEVVAFAADARRQLADLEAAEETAAALGEHRLQALAELEGRESALRHARRAAAPGLAMAVEARLGGLAMAGARLEVAVAEGGTGEPVRFGLGANLGEAVQPLGKVASGGELARAMLALRLVAAGGPPTMVFDEVDAGVGGAAALALGAALREVADHRQVLVVTHLAQVAAFADQQVAVVKTAAGGRTSTAATALDPAGRVEELSRMLSGQPGSAAGQATAEELLALARPAGASTASPTGRVYRARVHQRNARAIDR